MNLISALKKIAVAQGVDFQKVLETCDVTESQLSNATKNGTNTLVKKIAKKLNVPEEVLRCLALERSEVPERKLTAYDALAPTMDQLMLAVFCKKLA